MHWYCSEKQDTQFLVEIRNIRLVCLVEYRDILGLCLVEPLWVVTLIFHKPTKGSSHHPVKEHPCPPHCLTFEIHSAIPFAALLEAALEPGVGGQEMPSHESASRNHRSAERVKSR